LGITEPTKGATPVNAFTERVIGTIRREALDPFLLISKNQVRKIIREYIDFYNHLRPHQSIDGIPGGNISRISGNIKKGANLRWAAP